MRTVTTIPNTSDIQTLPATITMATQEKPLVCIVHGAWHGPVHYRPLINALRAAGHTVLCPTLATSGYDDSVPGMTHTDDVARIHSLLLPHLDAGRKAIIVAHSYGGLPGNMAVEGHSLAEREKKGLKGGIVGVAYMACLSAVKQNVSLLDVWGGKWANTELHGLPKDGLIRLHDVAHSKTLFYADIDDARASEAAASLGEQSEKCMTDPVPYVGQQIELPKTYFVCMQDKVVPVEFQRIPAEVWGAKIVEIDAGHSPFLKDAVLPTLVKVIGELA